VNDATEPGDGQDPTAWIRQTLDTAVERITSLGLISGELVEARPVWSLPFRIMVGQLREKRDETNAYWIVAGAGPTDFIELSVATTPRDAARHFSLKWQLDAARYEDPAAKKTQQMPQQDWDRLAAVLRTQAEALYALVENDALWQPPPAAGAPADD